MKRRTGYLFKRGDNFYVSWKVNGKPCTRALRDEKGQPITNRREAEEAQAKFMAPFAVADEAAALESLVGRIEGRKAELVKLEEQQNPALPLDQKTWLAFVSSPNRPDSGGETLYQYECQWNQFATWMHQNHPDCPTLRHVTKGIAEDYAGHLNHDRLTPNTYNKHLNLLALVFRVLKDKAKLVENPWESPKRGGTLQRKRIVTHNRRELTVDELKRVCQKATGELRSLLALGVYSGLRLGDCATLRWGEVDLARGTICRIPNKTARRNPKPVLVPIHPVLKDMLAETPTAQRTDYVLPKTAALYLHRNDAVTDLVQAHFKTCGITLHAAGTGKEQKAEQEKPGKDHEPDKRAVVEVGFHSLRHTFVSLCRESNAPLAVVESIVGHSNPAMTRHYTHVGELAAGRAVALLPAVIGEQKAQQLAFTLANVAAEAKAIAASIGAKTWKAKQQELLALLEKVEKSCGESPAQAAV